MSSNKVFKSCIDKENWLLTISLSDYIKTILELLDSIYPNATTELRFTNPYTFLIAVLLSAQATDKSVNKATVELFKIADNPKAMLNLGVGKLLQYIKNIGLHNTKAKHIIELSRILIDKYQSQVPLERDVLETLPGIGRKSANVIVNKLCNAPYIAVDTHVMRLSHRLGFVSNKAKTPIEVENELYKNTPSNFHLKVSDLLVLHGRYVCKSAKPKCRTCPLHDYCRMT